MSKLWVTIGSIWDFEGVKYPELTHEFMLKRVYDALKEKGYDAQIGTSSGPSVETWTSGKSRAEPATSKTIRDIVLSIPFEPFEPDLDSSIKLLNEAVDSVLMNAIMDDISSEHKSKIFRSIFMLCKAVREPQLGDIVNHIAFLDQTVRAKVWKE
jgi:hypothetical protein